MGKVSVMDVYRVMKKQEYWAIYIYDMSGTVLLGHCNEAYKWEDIPEVVREMEIKEITPCSSSLYLKADFVAEAAYRSEERCTMDGYEKVYDDPNRGPVYAKGMYAHNAYSGDSDFMGYTFAVIEGYGSSMLTVEDDEEWQENESRIEFLEAIETKFEYVMNAVNEPQDELDFYMDLVEMGATVDDVRECMGDELADHMKEFCEEHGLI